MSASAQEPVDPASTGDGPTEDSLPENAAGEAYAASAGQPRRPNPFLASPNVDSTPASARAEQPQLSWPPWQPQRASAGDTASVHSRAQPADKWSRPADHSKHAQARYSTGLIVIVTAAAAGIVSYLWSSYPRTNPPDRADVVSTAPNPSVQLDPAPQLAARAIPSDSARRSVLSQWDEAGVRERARQLTIKAARLWQVDAPARLTVSATEAPADVDVVIIGL